MKFEKLLYLICSLLVLEKDDPWVFMINSAIADALISQSVYLSAKIRQLECFLVFP